MGERSMTESRPKRRGGWLIAIGALCGLVLLVIALLPTLLSSQWGKERILGMAAPNIPAMIIESTMETPITSASPMDRLQT